MVLFQHALAGHLLDIYPNALSECIEEALKICFAGHAVLITRLSSVHEYEPAGGVGAGCGDFSDSCVVSGCNST
jgi:hypothetical protein